MTVLIAGCGDLGTEIGLRLAELGHTVVGIRRSADKLPAPLLGQSVDLTTTQPHIPADTNLVVVAIAASAPTVEAYQAAYVDGLRNLLDALDAAQVVPTRMLVVSSTAVYKVTDGSWVTESTPTSASSPTDQILIDAEQLLRERMPHASVFRLAGIYGPGRERLISQVREGRATVTANPRHTNRIHRDDAAAAAVHLLLRADAPAPIYIGVDSDPALRSDVLEFLATELNAPAPTVSDTDSERGGDKRCSNALLLATGFQFRYPSYVEGYRALLAGEGVRHP
ncbi:MAG TPA: SDR family NAD(P)-dependent oxidoreductase [Glaciihabitans sp.]|jgi:nucleoside-diphosphate-sugar epimerase|nr:SDR family NAD(P)-dependent oxidoreductase [Glaciihabitans sp.]